MSHNFETPLQKLKQRQPMTNEQMALEITTIKGDVKAIKDALLGNELNTSPGLVTTIKEHDIRLKKLEDKENKEGWMSTLFWAGAGGVVTFLAIKLVESFLK